MPHKEKKKQKTIIVTGLDRGGTSAVAGLLRMMAVDMGEDLHYHTHENENFYKLFLPGGKEIIEAKNKKHDIWGFKRANLVDELDHLDLFRNPYLILVTRDPYASLMNDFLEIEEKDYHKEYKKRVKRLSKMMEKVNKHSPRLIVSYEKLIVDKFSQLERIYNFIDYKLDNEAVRQCLNWIDPVIGYNTIPPEPPFDKI